MRLDGRVALVTGASRGIGAEVCRAYAREGAAVCVNHYPGPDEAAQADKLVTELREGGARAIAVAADVAVRADVEAMVERVGDELGTVDVLVANAAASGRVPWRDIDAAEWRRVVTTNLDGALFCAQAVHDGMRELGRGSIVTVSSVMVALGARDSLHYVTTKAGILGFTRALAREVGRDGITVNCVMPGAIRTEHELETFPIRRHSPGSWRRSRACRGAGSRRTCVERSCSWRRRRARSSPARCSPWTVVGSITRTKAGQSGVGDDDGRR